ncbi:MAG TPA: PQQ-binding-like beta-propeller repeat protein [Anaerolineae bacterium]|nr:PQQ-binding-like beta-propeller repeat protein [Anaerolineae bacterium]HQK14301.1 PQQ-binding-like beta-propeller repeat protein [Anaerolineae bacterium]
MHLWRTPIDRLDQRGKTRRGGRRAIAALLLLFFVLSGCAGGLRHESWPGMIVDEGIIYAANLERVQALNAETGKLLWSFPDESDKNIRPFYSTPVLAEDYGAHGLLLIAGYKDKTVYALALGESRAERPDLLWTFAQAKGQYVGSGVVVDGKFIIGNGDGNVYALDLDDGTLVWTFPAKDRVWATPLVVEDTVYIASLDHTLYALDVATGGEKWKLELGGAIAATPIFLDGALWVGDFTSKLYQIDPSTHQIIWTFEAQDWLWATPLVDGAVMYFADVGGHVYALDTETRQLVWDKPAVIDDVLRSRPVLNADNSRLFVAGYEKGVIHALDTQTGMEMNWGAPERNPGRLPGDLVTDGVRLYAMPILTTERIKAFDMETGKPVWVYPPTQAK